MNEGGRAGRCGQPCPSPISHPRHPLHTPALISRCEPRPPCDRPFSREGMAGVHSTSEFRRQRLPPPPPFPCQTAILLIAQLRLGDSVPVCEASVSSGGREQTTLSPFWPSAKEDGHPPVKPAPAVAVVLGSGNSLLLVGCTSGLVLLCHLLITSPPVPGHQLSIVFS